MLNPLPALQRLAGDLARAADRLAGNVRTGWDNVLSFLLPRRKLVRLRIVEGAFPKQLKPNLLYVLTEDGEPWQAAMICPCGCGVTLDMNLLTDERPCWRYSANKHGGASLEPSVWRKIGCKSHFWLRGGKVIWS